MNYNREFFGKDMVFYVGKVEDRGDPLQLGRIKVRCFGYHNDEVTVDQLPWAETVQPVDAPPTGSTGLQVGRWVFGFFWDGEKAQRPVVIGHIPGYNFSSPGESDLPRGARGSGTVDEKGNPAPGSETRTANRKTDIIIDPATGAKWDEPEEPGDHEYPTTQVVTSENGTYSINTLTGRYAFYTPSGTYVEIQDSGDTTVKVVTDKYKLVAGTENIDVGGTVNLTVGGDINWNVGGNWNMNVGGNVKWTVGGNVEEGIGGNQTTAVGGNLDIDAAKIDLN